MVMWVERDKFKRNIITSICKHGRLKLSCPKHLNVRKEFSKSSPFSPPVKCKTFTKLTRVHTTPQQAISKFYFVLGLPQRVGNFNWCQKLRKGLRLVEGSSHLK
eukprot:GHVT01075845.1.p1 GENE.GHVT01075845.1~~GHVT01075845.1.p1  ORF type:complete len:104 (-),score=4.45 GHVT01075845.1:197-508(-)